MESLHAHHPYMATQLPYTVLQRKPPHLANLSMETPIYSTLQWKAPCLPHLSVQVYVDSGWELANDKIWRKLG